MHRNYNKLIRNIAIVLAVILVYKGYKWVFADESSNYPNLKGKQRVYYFNSKIFEDFSRKAPVSLEKAWLLGNKYGDSIIRKHPTKESELKEMSIQIIVDKYYVFSKSTDRILISRTFLKGIWVDSKTGECSYSLDEKCSIPYVGNGYSGKEDDFYDERNRKLNESYNIPYNDSIDFNGRPYSIIWDFWIREGIFRFPPKN